MKIVVPALRLRTTHMTFQNIAVIGAGTMGSGIAGQIANAGHNVLLQDICVTGRNLGFSGIWSFVLVR